MKKYLPMILFTFVVLFSFQLQAREFNSGEEIRLIPATGTGVYIDADNLTAGQFLKIDGGNQVSSQGTIDLAAEVSGVLPIANGGTGSATQNFLDLTTDQSATGIKNFQGKLTTESTTNGSIPCPKMTEAERDLIGAPVSGDCVYNLTSLSLNVYNGSAWGSVGGGGLDKWATAIVYAIDDVIWEPLSDKIYRANTGHTSTTFAADAANWSELSDDLNKSPIAVASTALVRFNGTGGDDVSATGILVDDSNNMATIGNMTMTGYLRRIGDLIQTGGDILLTGDLDATGSATVTGGLNVGSVTSSGSLDVAEKGSVREIGLELLSANPATPSGEMVLYAMSGDNNSIFSKHPDGTIIDYGIAQTATSAFCVIYHDEAQNVAGDNLADDVWEARTLNQIDGGSDCSFLGLANDQMTITQTGEYRARWKVPILSAGIAKTRLEDVSASGDIIAQGSNINSAGSNSGHGFGATVFTVTGAFSRIIEMQSYVGAGGGGGQGGSALNLTGSRERYSEIIIEKVQ